MSTKLAAWVACGVVWAGVGAAAVAQEAASKPSQGAVQPAAKMLPGNCLLYVEVKNVKALQESFKKTALYGLYTEPAMKEFVTATEKKVTEAIDKWLKDAWKSGGIENPPEKLPRPEGRIVVAMRLETVTKQVPNMEWSEEDNALKTKGTREVKELEPQVFVLADMGSHADSAKDLIKQLMEKSTAKGGQRSSETVRGLEVQILTTTESAAPAPDNDNKDKPALTPPTPKTIAWAWQGTAILMSSDVAFFKDVATRLDSSDQESLADDKSFQKIARKLEGDQADVWVYVSAKPLLEAARNKAADSPEEGEQAEKAIKSLGFDGLTGLGLAVAVAPNPMEDSRFRFLVGVDGAPRGLVEIFMPPAISTKPNALLTRDVASFFVVNCDMAKFYDKVLSIAQEISGQPVEETINASLKSMAGEGNEPINLRKDLMEQLAGPVTVLVQASKPYDGPNAEQFLFSIALRDGVTVDKTVGKLFSAALGSMPTEMKKNMIREMNGVNIYAIPMPGLMGGDPATAMTNPTAIAVVGQNLFIGQLESVQRCIRDSSKPADAADSITADPLYEQAAKLLPAQASAFIYGNQQISAEIQWTVLKKMALEEAKKAQEGGNGASARHRPASSINPMAQLLDMVKEYVDFTALPDFATVKKYFGAEVGYVTSSEDGIYGEFHHIKAPPAFGP